MDVAMRYDLSDLRLFLAVMDAGSITHGALAAGLSLSAASERLRAMEDEAGVPLLRRLRDGTVPTAAGDAIADHARRIMAQVADMRQTLATYRDAARTELRVAANGAAMTEHLPLPLGRFLAANPLIDVHVAERQSADIARAVRLGFFDFGILSDAVGMEGLVSRPFVTDRLVVVMRGDHELRARDTIRLADLAGRPLVCLQGSALQAHLDARFSEAAVVPYRRTSAGDAAGLCRMAMLGAGLGIVPEAAAHRHAAEPELACVPLAEPWAERRLVLAWQAERPPSGAAGRLLAWLSQDRARDAAGH